MSTELPTKPGPYYWREKDGDAWTVVYLTKGKNCVTFGVVQRIRLESMNGQWLPIPTAEELVELQAKSKMVDEGIDGWAIYDHDGFLVVIDPNEPGTPFSGELKDGYTCEPVTIVRKAKR